MIALDLVDVDDLPLVEDAQVHGLLRGLHQASQEGRGDVADRSPTADQTADPEGLEAETVPLGLGILAHVAARRPRREQPMDGGLAEPERVRELGHTDLRTLDAERLEHSEGVVDRSQHTRHLVFLVAVPRCRTSFRRAPAS
jgi:hypothetical protein